MKKYFITLAFVLHLWSGSDGAVSETDEILVSDPNFSLSEQQLRLVLREANLEELGFNRTAEVSTVTDENGKRQGKRVLRYMVKDECSQAKKWQEMLEKRFPQRFFSSGLSRSFSRDVQVRVSDRSTKYCLIGLESTFKTPVSDQNLVKRRANWAMWPRIRVRVRIRVRIRIGMKAKIKY